MKVVAQYLCIIACYCSITNSVFAQSTINELKSNLNKCEIDSIRLNMYCLLAKEYRSIDKAISRKYIDSVQRFVAPIEKAGKKLKPYHLRFKANSLTTAANIAFENHDFEESIRLNLECVRIYEKINIPRLQAISLSNLGALFSSLGKNKDAITYLKKSASLGLRVIADDPSNTDEKLNLADTYINLGGVHAKEGLLDSSIYFYNYAVTLYSETNSIDGVAEAYNGLVNGYRMRKDFTAALSYTQKALTIFKKLDAKMNISYSYINYSDIYLDLKDYTKALKYADTVEAICADNNFVDNLLYIYETKALSYEAMNDYKNELVYLKKHQHLKDSLSLVSNSAEIEEMQTKYETEKKETKIRELNSENKIQELQIQKNKEARIRFIITIVLIALVAIFLFGLAMFMRKIMKERKLAYVRLQQKNTEIQEQSIKLSEQSKLLSKYQSQMNPHFMFNALNSIQGFVMNDQKEKTLHQLQLFSGLMRETLTNSEKESISLEKEMGYLKKYLTFEQGKISKEIRTLFIIPENLDELMIPPMMIQPLMENIFKHAGLRNVEHPEIILQITEENKMLKICVKDNGVGINMSDKNIIRNSHAFSIIKSRLKLLFKAEENILPPEYFQIISKPIIEVGTEVKFCIPLRYNY